MYTICALARTNTYYNRIEYNRIHNTIAQSLDGGICIGHEYIFVINNDTWMSSHSQIVCHMALASDALQRYCNAILKNCNAIFDFKITLFLISNNAIFRFR